MKWARHKGKWHLTDGVMGKTPRWQRTGGGTYGWEQVPIDSVDPACKLFSTITVYEPTFGTPPKLEQGVNVCHYCLAIYKAGATITVPEKAKEGVA